MPTKLKGREANSTKKQDEYSFLAPGLKNSCRFNDQIDDFGDIQIQDVKYTQV